MAFNFNWSPLAADEDFYQRARDLLTTALNKSPKPPIIVDDIFVTEFNLGSVPPDLEILEIGDLAEDRFRGIFKMCYSGDAFLTLKTRVQANPLNTYLCAKPSFTSPQPLAAASGLTIPLQITLSEIKLSAFIILVFSKQKGLTLVFRNDPLESLKVSSTFDSIQFVRDYLQRTIEEKLRDLMMDELPAIIHRLSLRLWCPDQVTKDDEDVKEDEKEQAMNPLASPPLDPVDPNGHLLDATEISAWSLDAGPEAQSLFSQKNLFRLSSLSNANLTTSLANPVVREALFRAWASPSERSDASTTPPLSTPSLGRTTSYQGSTHTYTFSDADSQYGIPNRSSMVNLSQATAGLSLGSGRHSKAGRRKKTRVVNLRRNATSEVSSEAGDSITETDSVQAPASEPVLPTHEEVEEELAMPSNKVRFRPSTEDTQAPRRPSFNATAEKPVDVPILVPDAKVTPNVASQPIRYSEEHTRPKVSEKQEQMTADVKVPYRRGPESDTSSVIMDQAWIMKMAGEIARRVYEEKNRNPAFWEERDDAPPPAYEAS